MQLFKKTTSKFVNLPSDAPVWATGSAIYVALKR